MDSSGLEEIIDTIKTIKPILYKHLIRPDLIKSIIPIGSYHLLVFLEKNKKLKMTEISKELMISKPNVTSLINKLISAELVERVFETKDRRIIYIKMTSTGFKALEEARTVVVGYMKEKLIELTPSDLKLLANSLQNIKEILSKVI